MFGNLIGLVTGSLAICVSRTLCHKPLPFDIENTLTARQVCVKGICYATDLWYQQTGFSPPEVSHNSHVCPAWSSVKRVDSNHHRQQLQSYKSTYRSVISPTPIMWATVYNFRLLYFNYRNSTISVY